MSSLTKNKGEPAIAEAESLQARVLAQALVVSRGGKVQLRIDKKNVDVPELAVPLIAEIMAKMGAGESVEFRTIHDTLSTTDAADILNVSRPYVVKLLDEGVIPCEATAGNHRRIKRADLMAYK